MDEIQETTPAKRRRVTAEAAPAAEAAQAPQTEAEAPKRRTRTAKPATEGGEAKADAHRLLALFGREFAGEDGDENDVVNPEDDFEDDKRNQSDPGCWIGKPRRHGV